jgi:flagellum-specific peptidoglycan hydrolase FlgJ
LLAVTVFGLFVAFVVSDINRQADTQTISAPVVSKAEKTALLKHQFIEKIAPEAQLLQAQYGVRASISIAQAALESDWGRSQLSAKYNNFFGVKAGEGQDSVMLPTSEYLDGKWIKVDAPFRVYASWRESMLDHAKLLAFGTTYNPELYWGVINAANYTDAATALQTAGYATDPRYTKKIIKLIEDYQLYNYD